MREYTYKLILNDEPFYQKNMRQLFRAALSEDFTGYGIELLQRTVDGEPSCLVRLDGLDVGYYNPEKFDDMLDISDKADDIEYFIMANDMRPEEYINFEEKEVFNAFVEFRIFSDEERARAREIARRIEEEVGTYEPPRSVSKYMDKLEAKAERERERKEAAEAAAARKAEKKKNKKGLFGILKK